MRIIPTWLAGKVIYPLHEKLMHRPTFSYLKEIQQSQFLSPEEITQLQFKHLRRLLISAQQHCPWHAQHISEAGLDLTADTPLTLADLQKLPTMDKADARENQKELTWMGVPGGAYQYNTGGSSGQPLIFYYGRARQAADAAGRMRARAWFGVEVGEPEVYLWGAPVELNKTDNIKQIRDRLINQLVLNAFEMSTENMARYVKAITRFNPKCIYGYASSLSLLAEYIQKSRKTINLPHLRVICTTGEPLYPEQRALINAVFNVPVANEYGSRDAGLIGQESPEGQMLLMAESIILEVLDPQGQPVAKGEAGEAVITNLCSEAQPFIRYRTGDIITLSKDACKAGRGLPVIQEVSGRTTDFVVHSDGTIMHALAIIYILRAIDGIAEFKFIQHSLEKVEVICVVNKQWQSHYRNQIKSELKQRLGNKIQVEINQVEQIPVEASGKHRYVVSHVPLPEGLNSFAKKT